MTVWGATDADMQDQETIASAAGVTPTDHFAIRFRHQLSGTWSDWLYVKTRDFFLGKVEPHAATERAWEAGLPDMHAAQLRQLAFAEAVQRAGVSLDALEVEVVEYPFETVFRNWQRAAGR
jgi:hypothetical protein